MDTLSSGVGESERSFVADSAPKLKNPESLKNVTPMGKSMDLDPTQDLRQIEELRQTIDLNKSQDLKGTMSLNETMPLGQTMELNQPTALKTNISREQQKDVIAHVRSQLGPKAAKQIASEYRAANFKNTVGKFWKLLTRNRAN